ncbi:hypothetical protein C8R43DRAFT_1108015 [Mycena crocata]|nr:hypothetical protein C8R43DRAFT_1108015 [Mycena crocata]
MRKELRESNRFRKYKGLGLGMCKKTFYTAFNCSESIKSALALDLSGDRFWVEQPLVRLQRCHEPERKIRILKAFIDAQRTVPTAGGRERRDDDHVTEQAQMSFPWILRFQNAAKVDIGASGTLYRPVGPKPAGPWCRRSQCIREPSEAVQKRRAVQPNWLWVRRRASSQCGDVRINIRLLTSWRAENISQSAACREGTGMKKRP